jgi:hypothetical protein
VPPDETLQQKSLLPTLGPHRMGRSCLYFGRLADLDRSVRRTVFVEHDDRNR